MRLVHYSKEPLTEFRTLPIEERGGRRGEHISDKPKGLWVSDDACEDNWRRWCESENFSCESYKFAQEIELSKNANILHLKSIDDIDQFMFKYGAKLYNGGRREYINWKRVCAAYHGIVISPYIWERRLDGGIWYYGWDCASGCIWDGAAINTIAEPVAVTFMKDTT